MLQIKNLNIMHKYDLRTILKDFTFNLNEGDKAVIIGEEGNGKSTLMKIIYDDNLVSDYVEYTGEIFKNNMILGYLAQELSQKQKELTILEFCSELPTFYDLTPKELSGIASTLGIDLGIFYSDQCVGGLSGGEKVKLQLARILMQNPDVLLLDEPSNDIDIETLEYLEDFINSCKIPILFISHDETLIENTANVIIHLEQLRCNTLPQHTVTKKDYRTYTRERLNRLTHQEQVAKKERSDYEKQQERYRQILQKVEHQQNIISRQDPSGGRLLKKKMHSVKSMGRRFDKEYENMTEIPDSEDAIFVKFNNDINIPNGKQVFDYSLDKLKVDNRILAKDINLIVRGPEKICIIGKNGVGKTTLIRKIAEDLLNRSDIKASYMPQEYEEILDFSISPVEYLTITGDKEENSRIRTFLGSMRYTADEMNHRVAELSGGQKAKLLFLKMTMDGSNVLILDEPTRNFSPLSNPVIRNILREYKGAIISISHDRKYIKEVCSIVYELTKDGLVEVFRL